MHTGICMLLFVIFFSLSLSWLCKLYFSPAGCILFCVFSHDLGSPICVLLLLLLVYVRRQQFPVHDVC